MTVAVKFCLPGLSSRYLKCCTSLIVLLVMVVRENLLQIHSITEVVYNDPDLHNPLIFLPHQSSGGLSGSRSRLLLGLTSIAISNQSPARAATFSRALADHIYHYTDNKWHVHTGTLLSLPVPPRRRLLLMLIKRAH